MAEHVYKVVQLVGSSETSIEHAIETAVTKAAGTLRNLRWFEVKELRGQIEDGRVHHYQVRLHLGFTID